MATNAPALNLQGPLTLYSPEWWLRRLLARLRSQRLECTEFYDFYEGKQPLAFASDQFSQTFGTRYRRLPANFMPRVVSAESERLVVQGFRFGGEATPDATIWRIWQDNQMDAESLIAHEIALAKGAAYVLVQPSSDGPLITIEDPYETTLETAPGNRRIRLAALKVWLDDDGYMRAYLYLPKLIYKYRSVQRRVDDASWAWESTTWEPYVEEGEDFPVRNSFGVVPVIPLLNRPRRGGMGRSEIRDVMGNQNAINKLRFDALVASEAVAFPQRWMLNIDIPMDPDTGKPISPFRPGVTQLWATRKPTPDEVAEYPIAQYPEPQFGQFAASSLNGYIDMIREEVVEMAAISATPYYALVGPPTSVAPSGEAVKSEESGLVNKIEAQEVHFGEGWEEVGRLSLLASGQTAKARTDGEIIWKDAQTRNEAARTDSILKQYVAGLLPDELTLEELGYSPQQIVRVMAAKAADKITAAALVPPVVNEPTTPVIRTFGRDSAGNPVISRSVTSKAAP